MKAKTEIKSVIKSKLTRKKLQNGKTDAKKIKKHKSEKILDKDEMKPLVKKKSKKIPEGTEELKTKPRVKKVKTGDELKAHKEDIESLKNIDPEFYQFLKENDDQLLEFNWDDSDYDDDKVEKDASHDEDEQVHVPKEKLEVASDDSDFDDNDDDDDDSSKESDNENAESRSDNKAISLKVLKNWQNEIQTKKVSIEMIRNVISAFSSALASISDQPSKLGIFKVEGASTFNAIIQICVLHLQQAVYRFLGYDEKFKTPVHKTKKWSKVKNSLRCYFLDLTKLIEHVSSTHILTVLLKHLHQMSAMLSSFQTISKPILKRLIVLWSTGEESVRVLSFLCILKIVRHNQHVLMNHILRAMYMSYVRNSKFVSPNTLPGINFMRRSLVEMFALDLNTTYQHAFLYIRQLAIHLRNAIILKKKESFQAVYNWQFINSLRLWADLLGATIDKPQLQPLIYPFVSITTGVIKLIPTAQFFPLRFHCIHALITLAKQTSTYVPVMPFILEVLNSNTFNKKHTIASMKPIQFTCILRLNKSQMAENSFRDEVIENVVGLTLEFLANESASIAFTDLVVPAVIALKQYLKICKNSNHSRKLKQILDKIVENSKFIENERKSITFGLKDTQLITAWETAVRNKGTPLGIYYTSWLKTHEIKKKRQASNVDNINDYNLPMIKRKKLNEIKNKKDGDDSDLELFPSDSENDEILPEESVDVQPKPKKKKHKKATAVVPPLEIADDDDDNFNDDQVDIVEDLDIDNW